jgi:2-polyprenyl-3-methyl-5-hydroxy-6-metoxy-1,4-benzoquinol methylase
MTVVEIGSSVSERTYELAGYCKKLIGIDIDKTKICQPKENIEVINADWQNLSLILRKNSIDMVVSSHVIEHVPDDIKAINETYEILKDGGILMFTTPNRLRVARLCAKLIGQEKRLLYPEHIREYAYRDIEEMAIKSKFNIYRIEGIGFGLHTGIFLCFLKKYPKFLKPFASFWEVILQK